MNDATAFIGYWKITEMEVWAPAYIDLMVPEFIEFQYEDRHLSCGRIETDSDPRPRLALKARSEFLCSRSSGCGMGVRRLAPSTIRTRGDPFRASRSPSPGAGPSRWLNQKSKICASSRWTRRPARIIIYTAAGARGPRCSATVDVAARRVRQ
jgi:hypothetical protein